MPKIILIVNDESSLRESVRKMLSGKDYKFLEAPDGRDCLSLASRHRPALILLDTIMPGLDGYTVLARLQENPRTASIPVVIFAAQKGEIYRELARELGAADFLSPDDEPKTIRKKIEEIMSSRPGGSPNPE